MKYKIIKINNISGKEASVYSIILNNEEETLLNKFVKENEISFKSETKDILKRLYSIGHTTGARIQFFKEWEGKPGDGVCALFDIPTSDIRTLQQVDKLKAENYLLREISVQITQRIKDKEISYTNDFLNFEGNLEFNDEE